MRVAAALNRDALELPRPDGDDLEPVVQAGRARIADEPRLRRAPHPPQLLRADHLERVAEAVAALPLHLAEDEPSAAAGDQVELVASGPDVRPEDAVAAQPIVPGRSPFELCSFRGSAHVKALAFLGRRRWCRAGGDSALARPRRA